MTKLIFAAAALAAAAISTIEPSAARNVATRHAQAATQSRAAGDCVRAPNVGSFATAPFTQPPCLPGTMR